VHVLAHGLQYGTGVFEGMKSYPTADGPAIFRLDAHLERFYKSAEVYDLVIPYPIETIADASREVVKANKLEASYLRPVAFFDAATLSVWTAECPVSVAIAAVPTGKYLANADAGVRVTVSPVRKFDNSAIPAWAKACGQYINSARAVNDAQRKGFDEALLLNSQGLVAEGSGENLFVVKDGVISTPGFSADILGGINRASAIQIARDLGYEVVERDIARGELYIADEVFMTGTAAELTPIREIDDRPVGTGEPGEITRVIQREFEDALHGRSERYAEWLDVVPARAPA
jgi:branched-chain amino acid aminotransferase